MLTVDKKLKALNEEQSRCSDGIENHVLIVERDLSNVQEQVSSLLEQQDDKSAITDIINRVEQLQEDMTKISTAAEDMVTGQAERKEIFQVCTSSMYCICRMIHVCYLPIVIENT